MNNPPTTNHSFESEPEGSSLRVEDQPPTILVTGAKGQLGKKIHQLLATSHKLILTDSDDMDITDKSKVHQVVKSESPDVIIHGAAYTQVDKAEENVELCRKVNSLGTKNIAEVAKEFDVPVIYISTDYVFDGKKNSPYTEEDKPNPLSVYGLTKYEGEEFIRTICKKYYIIRSAWIFGELPEGHPGTNFVETMLRLAKEKNELNIVSDQIGSPTYTEDLVEVIDKIVSGQLSVVSKDKELPATSHRPPAIPYGTYHFSGTGAASWYDFAKEIFNQSGIGIKVNPITSDQYPQKAKRPAYSYLDKSKIENALNIKVRPWQEMLKDYLKNR